MVALIDGWPGNEAALLLLLLKRFWSGDDNLPDEMSLFGWHALEGVSRTIWCKVILRLSGIMIGTSLSRVLGKAIPH